MSAWPARRIFIAGLLIFLAAKLYLVIFPSLALAIPRLGDDSLVYLWKAKLAFLPDAEHLPALQDILAQRFLSDGPGPELEWMRSNVAQRTLGHLTPSYNLLVAGALAVTPDLRMAFALTEVIGVFAMAAGMGWLLFELVGFAAAGLALMLMAFAILPNQGVYAFIPSTLALSCGLILWAYLWRQAGESRAWVIALWCLFLVGLHPIAKIYVLLAPVILWLRIGHWRAWRMRAVMLCVLACLFPVVLSLLLPVVFPALRPPPSGIMGGLDLLGGVVHNLEAVRDFAWDPVVRKNLLWAVLLLGALLSWRQGTFAKPLAVLISCTVALLLASLVFWLPAYPAELFSRLLVLLFLLTAAAGARFVLILGGKWRLVAVIGTLFGVFLSAVFWVVDYVPNTMNWRNEILEEKVVEAQLAAFPAGSTLMYLDTTVALQASLLLGGEKLGALAYPMLAGGDNLPRLFAERHPAAIVTTGPTGLNSLAARHVRSFDRRRQGIYMPVVESLTIGRNQGEPLAALRLLIESDSAGGFLESQAFDAVGRPIGGGERSAIPEGTAWLSLPVPEGADSLTFKLPADSKSWILGLGSGLPLPHVLWPWREGWSLDYTLRGKRNGSRLHLDFMPRVFLNGAQGGALVPYVDKADPVISDDGGLVFFRTWLSEGAQ